MFDVSLNMEQLLTNFLSGNKSTSILYRHPGDERIIMEKIKRFFLFRRAAGGIVVRDDSVLSIYRFERWDFPKGHVEPGETDEETAVREVTEETGIDCLSIGKDLGYTYHIFLSPDNRFVLKETHWYEMSTTTNKTPSPQTEESILRVAWIPLGNSNFILNQTYPALKDLIEKSFSKRTK
jgi:8-oxo-dGTP pyrophosphatase MutT (NUDIX family)